VDDLMVQHSSIDHTGLTGVSTLSFGSNSNSVAIANAAGASPSNSRADHVHLGVTSISHTSNTFSGPVTLVAGANIGITSPSSGTYRIDGGAGSGGSSDLSGAELSYVAFTADASITATTEATADTVVTAAAVAFDGSPVLIEFFTPASAPQATAAVNLIYYLYDGASSIGLIGQVTNQASSTRREPTHVARRLTPSIATHTYSIRASTGSGTSTVRAGAGGLGNLVPGFIRITRV